MRDFTQYQELKQSGGTVQDILALAHSEQLGKLLQISMLVKVFGMGLKEAKTAVEAYEA